MKAHIRCFTLSDRPSLKATIDAICAEGCWMFTSNFQPTSSWRHALEEPTCSCHCLLIAEVQDRIVGWCRVLPSECKANVNDAELGIELLPNYRNQGLGTALVHRTLDWAREENLHHLRLRTRRDNTRARRVFTHCGFHPVSIRAIGLR